MPDTLELPDGEAVTPDDVFLYGGYPYRFRPRNDEYAFDLVPLYWGNSDLDVPFHDREALVDQWDAESRGVLTDEEWEHWLAAAREDDRFGHEELDALARELPVDAPDQSAGLLARLGRLFGL
jgi:hypothetical protein